MNFTFLIEVEVNRVEGKFATKDEIRDEIQKVLEDADPSQYEGENGGSYETGSWTVTEQDEVKAKKAKKA